MRTALVLDWGDSTYPFKLSVAGVIELQTKVGCGVGELFSRVFAGRYEADGKAFGYPLDAKWRIEDLLDTIRLALIGGGMEPVRAKELMAVYCYPERPLHEAWDLAASILGAVVEGINEEAEGLPSSKKKSGNGKAKATGGSTEASATPTSP